MEKLSEQLINQLNNCRNTEDAVKLFQDNGINISKDELDKMINKYSSNELSDEDLENVAGGAGIVDTVAQYFASYVRGKITEIINGDDK